jgi:hypothetical protein
MALVFVSLSVLAVSSDRTKEEAQAHALATALS